MKIHQWEVWKGRPPGFEKDHWFVILSGQERCDNANLRLVNGLACYSLRGQLDDKIEVRLDAADGFAAATVCPCDFVFPLEKSKLHSTQGFVSWERQQQIKSKLKQVLRL
ncbi:MAG: hypothetical protein C5B50_02520 [Verrucomicrobia bacterium]|nr:MAG: hypothetical protein C5B50_02520 [Verrucomicrobiota bacterium]